VGAEHIPAYTFPENAVRALSKVAAVRRMAHTAAGLLWGFDDVYPEEARSICRAALEARGEDWLTDVEMRRVLHAFGLPVAASAVAHTADDAAALAAVLGFPVVAKLLSHRVQHKTEIGGVRLNLQDADAVREAFDDILARAKNAGVFDRRTACSSSRC
jgi:acetyltransferase